MDPIFIYTIIIMVEAAGALFCYDENLILAGSVFTGHMAFCIIMALITWADRRRRENKRENTR